MKKLFLFLSFIAISGFAGAQSQSFLWTKQFGGKDDDKGESVTLDAAGNMYVTGNFSGTVDFDPGPGEVNLTAQGYRDAFVLKLNALGSLVWVKQMGAKRTSANGRCIKTDASGNVYTTGFFQEIVDFDPNEGELSLTSKGKDDIFVQKLDANGKFIWARRMGGVFSDCGTSLTIDAVGNVYTTGFFQEKADFDPSDGEFLLTSYKTDNDVFTAIFIQKMDASGKFVWAVKIGGEGDNSGNSITIDPKGDIYVTGSTQESADVDPDTRENKGDSDILIIKLDASGNILWNKHIEGTGPYNVGNSIQIDAAYNVYVAGFFTNTIDFDPGKGTLSLKSNGGQDIFILKLDAAGNFKWAKQIGAEKDDYASGLAIGPKSNVYVTGCFVDKTDFDPSDKIANLSSKGINDIFVMKLDESGNLKWAKAMGGPSYDQGLSIVLDPKGNVYTTGYFKETVDFDPGEGSSPLISNGSTDIFLQKISYKK